MADTVPKAKYKLGQKVWYIADGYVTSDIIRGVLSQDAEVLYTFEEGKYSYNGGCGNQHWTLSGGHKYQSDVYATKKALIKSIEDSEEE